MWTEAQLRQAFAGRRVLVTGHTGFKGGWLAAWLLRLGARVTGMALAPPTSPSLFAATRLGDRLERHIEADIRSLDAVRSAFEACRPEVVFHAAAQALVLEGYRDPHGTFDTNVRGTLNVLECARRAEGLAAIVTVTSDKCYANQEWLWGYREGDPLGGRDPYAASKAAAELVAGAYLHAFFEGAGVGAATVRAGNVVGGGDWAEHRLVPDVIRALERGESAAIRSPGAIRPWQHVLEPLSGYLVLTAALLSDPRAHAGPWNFGPEPESAQPVRRLCDGLVEAWGAGSWTDASREDAPHEAGILRLSSDKARTLLGWTPRWGLDQTVTETVAWYRAHREGGDAAALCDEQIARYAP